MKTVNIHEAKTHLSALVREVRSGRKKEIILAVGGTPAAKIVPYGRPARRVLGIDEGLVEIADDFDARNDAIAQLFEGDE